MKLKTRVSWQSSAEPYELTVITVIAVITVLTVLTELTVLTVSPKISPYLIFSSFRIVANFGSFRESLPKAVRVFRLTEDLAAIRRYLIPNLGKIPQSLEIGFR
jgi:hypothetical protein